ncbi:hypothetical protein K440DRAFT_645218 [Wilcoxina mikolae CBS 423.85]|nr:hypothetical protein K440DRAFT_645218 [Wilcoxina mikolae CBS 423.85]
MARRHMPSASHYESHFNIHYHVTSGSGDLAHKYNPKTHGFIADIYAFPPVVQSLIVTNMRSLLHKDLKILWSPEFDFALLKVKSDSWIHRFRDGTVGNLLYDLRPNLSLIPLSAQTSASDNHNLSMPSDCQIRANHTIATANRVYANLEENFGGVNEWQFKTMAPLTVDWWEQGYSAGQEDQARGAALERKSKGRKPPNQVLRSHRNKLWNGRPDTKHLARNPNCPKPQNTSFITDIYAFPPATQPLIITNLETLLPKDLQRPPEFSFALPKANSTAIPENSKPLLPGCGPKPGEVVSGAFNDIAEWAADNTTQLLGYGEYIYSAATYGTGSCIPPVESPESTLTRATSLQVYIQKKFKEDGSDQSKSELYGTGTRRKTQKEGLRQLFTGEKEQWWVVNLIENTTKMTEWSVLILQLSSKQLKLLGLPSSRSNISNQFQIVFACLPSCCDPFVVAAHPWIGRPVHGQGGSMNGTNKNMQIKF